MAPTVRRRGLVALALSVVVGVWLLAAPALAFADGTISGTVTSGGDANPAGAEVAAFTVDTLGDYSISMVSSTTAGPDGAYALTVPAGTYLVGVREPLESPQWQFFTARRGGNAMNPFTAVVNTGLVTVDEGAVVEFISPKMLDSAVFNGRVSTNSGNDPLGAIHVSAVIFLPGEGWEAVEETLTGPDGTYSLQVPTPGGAIVNEGGPFVLRFSDDKTGTYALQAFEDEVYMEDGFSFNVIDDNVVNNIDARMRVAAHLTGTVTSAATGNPLSLISVEVYRFVPVANRWEPVSLIDLPPFTKLDGTYDIGGLTPGQYKVKFAGLAGIWGPEFYGGIHVTDPNSVPAAAMSVTVSNEGEIVTGIDAELDIFDGAAPVTTSGSDANWHRPPYTFALSAIDPAVPGAGVPSGVAWTAFRVNGEASVITTPPVVSVSQNGTSTVTFRSADNYGNVEPTRTATVKVDGIAPVTTTNAGSGTYTNVAAITFSATDSMSGVGSTWVSVDGKPAVQTTSVRVYRAGSHTIKYWSVDAVGNRESTKTKTVRVALATVALGRINGSTVDDMSVRMSLLAWPDATPPDTIILAGTWQAGLAASSLAKATNGALLMVDANRTTAVFREIDRLAGNGAQRIIIVGGTSVPQAFEDKAIAVMGSGNVERISASDTWALGRRVASRTVSELEAGSGFSGTVLVVSATKHAEAMAAAQLAARYGWPVVFSAHSSTSGMSASMRSHLLAIGADQAVIVGGVGAVPTTARNALVAMLPDSVTRLSGPDRYATCDAVARKAGAGFASRWNNLLIIPAEQPRIAGAAGVLQARRNSVYLMTEKNVLPTATKNRLKTHRPFIFTSRVAGSTAWVSSGTYTAVKSALR